jgi:hypothetical protein
MSPYVHLELEEGFQRLGWYPLKLTIAYMVSEE